MVAFVGTGVSGTYGKLCLTYCTMSRVYCGKRGPHCDEAVSLFCPDCTLYIALDDAITVLEQQILTCCVYVDKSHVRLRITNSVFLASRCRVQCIKR